MEAERSAHSNALDSLTRSHEQALAEMRALQAQLEEERNLKEELSKQKEELSVSQVAETQATAEELKKLRGEVEKHQKDSAAVERQ
eukprot:Skav232748  [mRNA]  locus=scaffold4478:85364:87634:+ [translate_table: standard]